MAISKVMFGGDTLVDLTGDTVTPESLLIGVTAHDSSGNQITGSLVPVTKEYVDSKRISTQITLLASGWNAEEQTVSVTGVTESNDVYVAPDPDSLEMYCNCGVVCTTQGNGTLAFICGYAPDENLTVNIAIYN